MVFGLIAATSIIFLRDAAAKGLGPAAQETGIGFTTIGTGIGQSLGGLGTGFQQFGTGVGRGVSRLFDPLFTLRDLTFGPQAGQQAAPTPQDPMPTQQPPTQRQPEREIAGTITTPRGSISLFDQVFKPSGQSRDIQSIRGTPLAPTAISRTQETFGGVLSTSAGGDREIRGSQALFQRLQSNLGR